MIPNTLPSLNVYCLEAQLLARHHSRVGSFGMNSKRYYNLKYIVIIYYKYYLKCNSGPGLLLLIFVLYVIFIFLVDPGPYNGGI